MLQTEREYAQALFALALEEKATDAYLHAMGTVKQLFQENPDYMELLASPAISLNERLSSVDEAFAGRMPEHVVSFLKVLCENGRVRTVLDCVDEFARLAMESSGRTVAKIYSAVTLREEQKAEICKKLEQLTKKTVDPIYLTDESLIGGMKIEVDGKTFDGSIKHRLSAIKDVMNV